MSGINFSRYESLKYVDLPKGLTASELEVVDGTQDDPTPRLALHAEELGDKGVPLGPIGFENLATQLGIPNGFAKKLTKSKKTHVMAYLQRQLAGAWGGGIPLVAVVDQKTEEIVSVTEKPYLFFHGGNEIQELDMRIREFCAQPDSEVKLMSTIDGEDGLIHYRFRHGKEREVDPAADDSLWAWGLGFSHSPYGVVLPKVQKMLERLVCANLTYIPEKVYAWTPRWEDTFEARWKIVEEFLLTAPEPQYGQLEGYLRRARQTKASLAEVSAVRRQLKKFLRLNDDEAAQRIDTSIHWAEIVEAYPEVFGPDADFKPSKKWLSAASTPVSIFDLYNYLTEEATHAPSDADEKALRMPLLISAGELLTKTPDLQDVPRQVVW